MTHASQCNPKRKWPSTMVNCRISPDRKLCALNLWDHGWEIEDICFAMMISRSSLYRWWWIFAEQVIVTVIDHADAYSNAHELQGQPKITKGSTLDWIHSQKLDRTRETKARQSVRRWDVTALSRLGCVVMHCVMACRKKTQMSFLLRITVISTYSYSI